MENFEKNNLGMRHEDGHIKSVIDLLGLEGCEPVFLEERLEKQDDEFDLTDYKAENLTPEMMKLFKKYNHKCHFSEEVQEKINNFEE